MNSLTTPELWAIDLDRALLDTDRAFAVLVETGAETAGVDSEALVGAKAATEASGGSFDVFGYLAQVGIKGDALGALYKGFVAKGREYGDLLYPESETFLAALDSSGQPNLILTYGPEEWQSAKLGASGLAGRPHLIVDQLHKGKLIESWRQPDGQYQVAAASGALLIGRNVVLLDDKAASFRGLPADCRGFLVVRSDSRVPSQTGEVPPHVQKISNLLAALPYPEAVRSAKTNVD